MTNVKKVIAGDYRVISQDGKEMSVFVDQCGDWNVRKMWDKTQILPSFNTKKEAVSFANSVLES